MQPADSDYQLVKMPMLTLHTAEDITAAFRPLLEQGFQVQIEAERTVQDILCRQLGVAENYLHDRVQTVFLNSKAVDDETTAVVPKAARLALSASMPGLVGATMRKGGFFSGLRAGISHQKPAKAEASKSDSVITIKLFNMIAVEIGSLFLEKGIGVKGEQLADLWARLGEDFWQQLSTVSIDGKAIDLEEMKAWVWADPFVRLRVVTV